MRTLRVITNQTCNQNCAFCDARRPAEDPELVARSRVLARLVEARGAQTLVLTGGEPTLRRDLPSLVRAARELGAGRVVLETNATLIDAGRAARLREAGLGLARVHLPGWASVYESVTRDPGSFPAALAGMRALTEGGIELEVATPLVRRVAPQIASLPQQLAESALPVRQWILCWPTSGPAPGELLDPETAAATLIAAEAAARRAGLRTSLAEDAAVPPCLLPAPGRLAHLFRLTPGGSERPGFRRVAACDACRLRDRCPGFPSGALDRHPEPRVDPIASDALRRRFSTPTDIDAQVAAELVQDEVERSTGESQPRIVRINFACNQACAFCFVSTHLPAAPTRAIETAISDIASKGRPVILSGGEPTLNPRLVDFVRLAKNRGAPVIDLQTNAVRLAEPPLADTLVAAGVTHFFISLHGPTAAISDAITGAPGTFERTVLGIDRAVATGAMVRLNFVFCRQNFAAFPDHVDFVARRWPTVELVLSFVARSSDVVPASRELIPSYSEMLPALAEGLRRAEVKELSIGGLDTMCGIPACLIPESLSHLWPSVTLAPDVGRGEFVQPEICAGCERRDTCFGVRRGYVDLYGACELRPIHAARPEL